MEPIYKLSGIWGFEEGVIGSILKKEDALTKTERLAIVMFREYIEEQKETVDSELYGRVQQLFKEARETTDDTSQIVPSKELTDLGSELRLQRGDLEIECCNGTITAHRSILSLFERSFFEGFLNPSFQQPKIMLLDYSKEAMELCLDLHYQKIHCKELAFEDLLELYQLTNYLCLLELNKRCENALKEIAEADKKYTQQLCEWVSDRSLRLPDQILYWRLDKQVLALIIDRYHLESEIDPLAMCRLGYAYRYGIGTDKNEKLAFEWYEKAAENGSPYAMGQLGIAYQYGIGTDKNEKLAFKWYEKAAENGDAVAMNNLGYAYKHGIGTDKNEKLAFKWCEKAAEQGNASAMNNLAFAYQRGIGAERNEKLAFKWYKDGAEQGNTSAMTNLGIAYKHGIGTDINEKLAFKWYKDGAEQGNTSAMNNLGYAYQHGIGTDKNAKLAFEWYKKAAENGNATAMNNLGCAYQHGIGTDKNAKLAFEWYKKAAENGNATAMNNLSLAYQHGIGTEKNEELAREWLASISR